MKGNLIIQPVPGLESVLVIEFIYMHASIQVLLLRLIYGLIFTLILHVPVRMMLRLSLTSCSRSEIWVPAGVTVHRQLRTYVGFVVSGCDHCDAFTALLVLASTSDNRCSCSSGGN